MAPLEIVWPSGSLQQVELAAGARRTVVEPKTVSVSLAKRRVVADAGSKITARTQPRTPLGDPDALTHAEINLVSGAATWGGTTPRDGCGRCGRPPAWARRW